MADLKFLDATSGDEAPGWKDRRHLWQSAKGKRSMTPVRRRAPAKSVGLSNICYTVLHKFIQNRLWRLPA